MSGAAVGGLSVTVMPDMKGFAPAVAAGSQAAGAAGSKGFLAGFNAKKVGLGMSAAVTAPIVLAGKAILDTGQKFESSFSRIGGIYKQPVESLTNLTDKAKQLGVDTQFSAVEAADAMETLARAGMDADTVYSSIDGVLRLAASDNVELADAAEIASAAINSFGLEASDAEKVADALAGASSSSATNVSELGEAFKNVASTAGLAEQTVPQTSAALAALADQGIKGAEAGTALNTATLLLAKPSSEAQKAIDKLGLSIYDSDGNMRSYTELAGQLADKTKNLTGEQRNSALATIFGNRGIKAANALRKAGTKGMQEFVDASSEEGRAAELAETALGGLEKQLNLLSGSLGTLAVELYETIGPVAAQVVEWFVEMTNKVLAFVKENPGITKIAVGIAAVAAAIGPAILLMAGLKKAIGGTVRAAAGLVGLGGKVGKAKAAACATMAAPCPPVAAGGKGAKAATGAASAVTLGSVGKAGSDIGKSAAKGIGGPLMLLAPLINPLLPLFSKIIGVVSKIGPLLARIGPILLRVAGPVGLIVTGVLLIGTAIKTVVDKLGGFDAIFQAIANNPAIQELMAAVSELGAAFGVIFDEIGAALSVVIGEIVTAFGELYATLEGAGVIDAIATAFQWLGNAIATVAPILGKIMAFNFKAALTPLLVSVKAIGVAFKVLAAVVTVAVKVITVVIRAVTATVKFLWKAIKTGVALAVAAFNRWKSQVAAAVKVVQGIWNGLVGVWNTVVGAISGAISTMIGAFQSMVGAVKGVIENIVGAITGFVGNMVQAGQDLISGLIQGIGNMAQAVIDKVLSVAGGAVDAVKNFFGISSPSKLFMEIGEDTIAGLAIGLTTAGDLTDILDDVFDTSGFVSWMGTLGEIAGEEFAANWAAAWKQVDRNYEDEDTARDRAREDEDADREARRNRKRRDIDKKIAKQQKILDDPKATKKEKEAAREKIKNLKKIQRQREKDWAEADKQRNRDRQDADRDTARAREDIRERAEAEREAAEAAAQAEQDAADAAEAKAKSQADVVDSILADRDKRRDATIGKAKITASAGASIRNMTKLTGYVKTTAANLKTLRDYGMPEQLLGMIAQMDPKDAARLSSQLAGNKELRDQFTGAYEGLNTAATNYANQETAASFGGVGSSIVSGILGGIQGGEAGLLNYIEGLGDEVLDRLKDVLGISSPSKEFMTIGDEMGNGLVAGLQRQTPRVASATARMVNIPGASVPGGAAAGGGMEITVNPSAGMDETALAVAVGREVSWALGT